MIRLKPVALLTLATMIAVAGCAKKDGKLMNLRSTTRGPDEFAVLPTKTLEVPKSYSVLPDPTPGGVNLTDPTPQADAVKALGGNPKVLARQGIPAGDQGIVQTASRYGVASGIRSTLATEDKEFRSTHRGKLLERLFGVTVYFKAYADQSLDRHEELRRLRRSGVKTPAAPPEFTQ